MRRVPSCRAGRASLQGEHQGEGNGEQQYEEAVGRKEV